MRHGTLGCMDVYGLYVDVMRNIYEYMTCWGNQFSDKTALGLSILELPANCLSQSPFVFTFSVHNYMSVTLRLWRRAKVAAGKRLLLCPLLQVLHPFVAGFLMFSYKTCVFPKAIFDRGYASVDSQWWRGWAPLRGVAGGPQEAENHEVEAVSQDISSSRYLVGWEFLLGNFFEVRSCWSASPWISWEEMRWAPTSVKLWYTAFDEGPTTVSDQETTAPATETSESENKKAAGWNVAQIKIPQSGQIVLQGVLHPLSHISSLQTLCWLMMIGDNVTQCIGDCGIHQADPISTIWSPSFCFWFLVFFNAKI